MLRKGGLLSTLMIAVLAHRLLAHTLAENLTLANRLIQASQR